MSTPAGEALPRGGDAGTPEPGARARKVFVLDTNVLMHDPTAIFRFKEHDIFLPMVVLEELDAAKKGVSEVARNVRQVSRFLDELIGTSGRPQIEAGLELNRLESLNGEQESSGRLYFQTRPHAVHLPDSLPGNRPDNSILATALGVQEERGDARVVLVSTDINLRIKAHTLGIPAEDYQNDKVLDDVNLLYQGTEPLPEDFWQRYGEDLESWQEGTRTFYRVRGDITQGW